MTTMLVSALNETLFMVFFSTLFSAAGGFGLAVLLILTGPHGLRPKSRVYAALDLAVNLLRSFPFMILMIALIPFTRLVAGVAYGSAAAIVPLTVAAIPFMARLVEGSLLEVDQGVVEAARSFGASDSQIIFRVMVMEALPAIILNVAVLAITLLGYSAMAGAIGGGGLGALAYNEGYIRFRADIMFCAVAVLIVVVQCIQSGGNHLYKKLR
ncbi:MAG: ABC transporter permease [Desulfovibrio sp.]|jgi:D-methionine transport system permease protein|nr:ABC transporter permease [Desulfovibrio sp.]